MKQPVNVLSVVASLGFGGDESRLLSILNSVDKSKFRFSVLVLPQVEGYDDIAGSCRPNIEATGVPVHQLENPSSPSWLPRYVRGAIRTIRKIFAVARVIRQTKAEIVDARLDGGTISGVPAAMLCRVPSIMTLYDAVPWTKYPFWRAVRAASLNRSSAIITDSAIRQTELGRWIWSRSNSVWNIPNGIGAPQPEASVEDVRAKLGLPNTSGCKVVGQIAGLVPYKGQLILLEAARKVLEREPDTFFLFIGFCREASQYQKQLAKAVEDSGLGHRVRICSYAGPIGDVWQLIDIHAHASLFDSLPNAILEGMSLGKPAVVTAVGGIPEAVTHEETGLVVPPGQAEPLAKAILRLLQNPEQAKAFGTAAHARYQARYRPEAMARDIERCLESVIGTDSKSRYQQ